MAQVLSGLSEVVYYIDNILITRKTREEHATNLQAVLKSIREHSLRLKKYECRFLQKSWNFWGIIYLHAEGIKSSVKNILKAPVPMY